MPAHQWNQRMKTEGGRLALRSLLSTPYPVRNRPARGATTVSSGAPTCCAEEATFDWSRNKDELRLRKLSAIRKSMKANPSLPRKKCDYCQTNKIRGEDTSPEKLGKMFEHWSQAAWGPPSNHMNLKEKKRACNDCTHERQLAQCVSFHSGVYISHLMRVAPFNLCF